nr:hypothetical protein Iba_chr04aCG23370 [Ipomoea batatas]
MVGDGGRRRWRGWLPKLRSPLSLSLSFSYLPQSAGTAEGRQCWVEGGERRCTSRLVFQYSAVAELGSPATSLQAPVDDAERNPVASRLDESGGVAARSTADVGAAKRKTAATTTDGPVVARWRRRNLKSRSAERRWQSSSLSLVLVVCRWTVDGTACGEWWRRRLRDTGASTMAVAQTAGSGRRPLSASLSVFPVILSHWLRMVYVV